MADTDPLAAELDAIEGRQEHGDLREFATADSPRLLKLARDVLALHAKIPLYALSVREFDTQEPPRVWCGHTYEETENSRHVQADSGDLVCLDKPVGDVCGGCCDDSGEREEWPCPTVLAVSAALLGESPGDPEDECEGAPDSEEPVIDMGYLSLPAEVQSDAEMHVAERPGGSMNPTPDCGGPRKPPGATEVWWCGPHREFHGAPVSEEESRD